MDPHYFLLQALECAQQRRGFCAPNPAVGAVVVKDNQVLAIGHHFAPGHAHAEVDALNKVGDAARGASLYVTLEPCCIWGRTPPCTDLLIKRGIAQVFYGFKDPNPQVASQGAALLEEAGIECIYSPVPEIDQFYRSYQHWWQTGLPWVTAKLALSSDGKIAGENGRPIAISGPEAALFTQQQRYKVDALLTTAKTIIQDDPRLNARVEEDIYSKPLYILDTRLETPLTAQVFKTAKNLCFFHVDSASAELRAAKLEQGARCVAVARNEWGLDWREILKHIGQDGIHDLWVEAGGGAFTSLLLSGYCNTAYCYVAPRIVGQNGVAGLKNADLFARAKKITWGTLAADALCQIDF